MPKQYFSVILGSLVIVNLLGTSTTAAEGFAGDVVSNSASVGTIGPNVGDIVSPQFDNHGTIVVVDGGTGNRSTLSLWPDMGDGPRMERPTGITIGPNGNYLVSESFLVDGLYEINPVTGDRTFLSGTSFGASGRPPSIGTGPVDEPSSVVVTSDDRVYLINSGFSNYSESFVTEVNLSTGNRTVVSGMGVGSGPEFGRLEAGTLDGADHLIVADYGSKSIVMVDLNTGERQIISGQSRGAGPAVAMLRDVVVLPDGSLIATGIDVTSSFSLIYELFRVDPLTGNRTLLSSSSDDNFDYQRIALGVDGVVLGATPDSIYEIDPITGDRTMLSSSEFGVGSGTSLFWGEMLQIGAASPGVVVVPEASSLLLAAFGLAAFAIPCIRRVRGAK